MFTGIITDIGRIKAVTPARAGTDTRIEIATGYDPSSIAVGASIACSGPCLTVVDKGQDWFAVEASAETLRRTSLGRWREGTAINLERSLCMGDELGGHVVTGHVDCVATVVSVEEEGGSRRIVVKTPDTLMRYIAAKGSVALEGVSLTVNGVEADRFDINVIRHTQDCTTFGELQAGDPLNLEVDVLARYVARQLGKD